jgi:riboflavin synthase
MFTGLIEALGRITVIETAQGGKRFTVAIESEPESAPFLTNVTLGDSIAVDGACMTVVAFKTLAFETQSFSFEASPESLACTILGNAAVGSRVNLERPLTPMSRIGGHYVTGHVDGMARLVSKTPQGNSIVLTFETDRDELVELLVSKGSVSILGISLTVNTVNDRQFSVAIIPHTLTHTTLGDYAPGAIVNIETDLLGKYVRRLMPGRREETVSPNTSENFGIGNGLAMDVPALQPAMEAIVSTRAFETTTPSARGAQIRTGGWFNFNEEVDATRAASATKAQDEL